MKRITTLLLALAMCLGSVAAAKAVELKASGTWDFAGGWDQTGFKDITGTKNDGISARQRVRTQVNFIVSEQLQGVLAFEIGTLRWGASASGQFYGNAPGGALDADGVNVETRRAYIDWLVPNTDATVRMGIQNVTLPFAAGMGNPVLSDDVAGIVVSSPVTDMFGVTAFWLRPYDAYGNDGYTTTGKANRYMDETDAFGLILPVTGEGWSVTPWGMAASIGSKSGYYDRAYPYYFSGTTNTADSDRTTAWWLGGSIKVDLLDPLTFGMDVMYGRLNKTAFVDGVDEKLGTKGWFVDAALNYKLDWATPGIFGWYASGDKAEAIHDSGYLGRLPSIGTYDGDGFYPTSFGFPGGAGPTQDGQIAWTGTGTWGVGVQLADFSFVDKLSHTLRVAYYQGTNNTENAREYSHPLVANGSNTPLSYNGEMYLTTGDHVWEVNFNHKYQIYENLAAYLELGYLNLSLDEDAWRHTSGGDHSDDAWKAQMLFKYSF